MDGYMLLSARAVHMIEDNAALYMAKHQTFSFYDKGKVFFEALVNENQRGMK